MEESTLAGGQPRPDKDGARTEVRRSIVEGSKLSAPYLVMNALATAVASYGLLADSAAVVIGAMIIAMLLGPIMGLALALVDGDTRLLRDALIAEAVGALMVVFIGGFIGRMHFDVQITNEILVRTKPNLLDLAVALFGGAAGAYATASPRVSVGLVGVAISTALVPPLASCGICLARGLFPQAGGAFILFATNLVAIQCASSVVLYLFGFHHITKRAEGDTGYVRRLVLDAVALLTLAAFLYIQLASTIGEQQFEKHIKSRLETGLQMIPGAYLSETRYVDQANRFVVVAVVRTPNSVTPEQTASLQTSLGTRNGKPIELHVRSLLTKEATPKGYLHVIEPEAQPVELPQENPTAQPATSQGGSDLSGEQLPQGKAEKGQ
ncbi:MAG TPA: TIGR00341 family protein [Fimbriimonadaceae bacterium]|nr:TIGR00341 family protein [Fimbriimonadaceae bacterium]